MPMLTTLRMRRPVCPVHAPDRTASAKRAMRSSTAWTSGTTSVAVDDDRRARGRAQGDVQDGAVLRDVDVLAGEHRVDPLAEPGLLGELDEQAQRLVGDPVLRVVEEQALGLRGQAGAPLRIVGEQLAQVHRADLLVMVLECSVRRALAQRSRAGGRAHGLSSWAGQPPEHRHSRRASPST